MKQYVTDSGLTIRVLETASDVTPEILAIAEETVDWFDDEPQMRTQAFIDRMMGGTLDIEDYDNPAARKIMRHARKVRRERFDA